MIEVGVGSWTLQSNHVTGGGPIEAVSSALVEIRAAERLGIRSAWIGEHHHAFDGYCSAPLTMAAAILAATSSIDVGIGVLLLPLHGTQSVVEACRTINEFAPGRLTLCLGMGYRAEEYMAAGADIRQRVRLFEERMDTLLADPRMPTAVNGVELTVAGGVPATGSRAARRGLGVLVRPSCSLAEVRAIRDAYDRCVGPSRPRAAIGMFRDVWVLDDPAEETSVRQAYLNSWRAYSAWWPASQREQTALLRKRAENVFIGTADQVAAELSAFAAAGVERLVCRLVWAAGLPTDEIIRSLQRLSNDVIPTIVGTNE